MKVLKPADSTELVEAITWAINSNTPVHLEGSGSKVSLGRPVEADHTLSLSNLSGITLFEPGEMVLSARAGTPLRDIQNLLAEKNLRLASEPVDIGPLLGGKAGLGTLGGMVATALSGPRRIKAGALRDHVLGFTAVTGRGDLVKSGGRVMKNVTGYDLSKLMTGSWGTLAAMEEITLKVLPVPDFEVTLLIHGMDDVAAIDLLTRITGTSLDGSGFAHLPKAATESDDSLTAVRLEGLKVAVHQRFKAMSTMVGTGTSMEILKSRSARFWQDIGGGLPLAQRDGQIWRLSTRPTSGPEIIKLLQASDVPVQAHYYDWAGGLIWLAVDQAEDAHGPAIRAALDRVGGHAMLLRAAPDVRRTVPVFHIEPAPLAALTKRVKDSFDPKSILNPDRMWEGV